MKPFSFYVCYLTELWLKWMKLNSITTNESISFKKRRQSAQLQERLTQKRYKIIEKINKIYETN